jgi:uncharacterized protein
MSTRAHADVVLPYKLARQGATWRGRVALEEFSRFGALVEATGADVEIELGFRLDDEGRCRVSGTAATRVGVECGRCLLPQVRDLTAPLDLCVVATDADAGALGAQFEPFVLDGEKVRVVELVEDDLILALPHGVCDEPETCPNRPTLDYPGDGEAGRPEATRNPFAALAGLKRR